MRSASRAPFPISRHRARRAILEALAAYERTLVSPPSRFDRWVAGDDEALTETESEGFDLFVGKAGCVSCHGGWRFTDDAFHDIGLKGTDPGRGAVEGGVPGLAQFKTPSLRELDLHRPLHARRLASATCAPSSTIMPAAWCSARPSTPTSSATCILTEDEKTALISFLRTLSTDAGPPHRD